MRALTELMHEICVCDCVSRTVRFSPKTLITSLSCILQAAVANGAECHCTVETRGRAFQRKVEISDLMLELLNVCTMIKYETFSRTLVTAWFSL